MHFNVWQKWDDPNAEISRKDGGEPNTIQRFYNSAMHFEWDYDVKHLKISKYVYDDPLTHNL